MLYYDFKDYEGFKELFGVTRHDNGTKSRRNKILLSFIKQRKLIAAKMRDRRNDCLNFTSLDCVKELIWNNLRLKNSGEELSLMGRTIFSTEFHTDKLNGLCFDGDYRSIRYVRNDNDRVFKMRAGKLMRKVLLQEEWSKIFPEQVVIWFCEEFAREWESYAASNSPEYTLHVNQDFNKIYCSKYLHGDFLSCMVDDGFEEFYNNNVDARAAYLTNENGDIVSRCVIFDKVKDGDNSEKIYRLAERQYSTNGSETLKQILINKLIDAGEIDGYKRVGADCHSPDAFLLNNGHSLSGRVLYIECRGICRDTLIPYMDSFKWYNEYAKCAYNYENCDYDHVFESTDGRPMGDEYDDYHDRYCMEVTGVYVNGSFMYCDVEDLEDFIRVNGEYHHHEDVDECMWCGDEFLRDDSYYSEILDQNFCCYSCMQVAEQQYIEENWYHSELTDEYYETEEELKDAENEYKQENGITEEE